MKTKRKSLTPTEAMERVTAEFASEGYTPYQINNGQCNDWAQEVLDLLESSSHKVEYWETLFGYADTTHAFIRIDGTFYDAECTQGVQDHMELPIFVKLFAKTQRRQPVWCIDCNNAAEQAKGESMRDMTHETVIEYYTNMGDTELANEYRRKHNL